jgi:hypothetical protein
VSEARPPNQLLSSLWKLDRAERLLAEIREGIVALGQSPDHAGIQEREPVGDGQAVWLVGWAYPAPFRFNAVVADFIHNLRASLDHLAWQLCGCPDPKRARVAFPIRVTASSKLDHAHLMTPTAAGLVDGVQPYRRTGRDDPLWILHDLWNQDKHRFTPLVSVRVWTHVAKPAAGTTSDLPHHGDLVGLVKANHQVQEVSPHVRTLAFSALSDRRQRNLIGTAEMLLAHVRDGVVPLFDRADCFP